MWGIVSIKYKELQEEAAEDMAMVRERLNSNYQIRASYEAYQAIRDKKKVEDMRYKFY